MVKILVLALVFSLAHAQDFAELQGKWYTIVIAADNLEKIEEGGPLRFYFRHIDCYKNCSEMEITFYVITNNQCSKTTVIGYLKGNGTYQTQFEGNNIFQPLYITSDKIFFTNKNMDRAGQETNMIVVAGKGNALTPEENEILVQFAHEKKIPVENILNILATDTCPE
ncbi:aphrodisin [Mesocricetus auratus]|uniref:Aphrodisin n=1 Tax=Mesocricetus auratus TaxID=10036 RepID=APHR_MESAU|nr:aphrodisin [Mesocricetus auratus]Q9Z1I7.1 RecName: Full=Aphrodisin; Flags: Precursor [Mesocricetus auratus]CAA12414.1 aphrodisin [Mesocricetus auratus]